MEIKDHRKFLEGKLKDADKVLKEEPVRLMEQEPIENSTGDQNLDKMLRGIEALKKAVDAHATAVALKGIGCVQDDMLKLQQFEYFYNKGKSDAFKEVSLLPAQILLEAKSGLEGTA